MAVISEVESPTRHSCDTAADAVAIPLEPWFLSEPRASYASLTHRLNSAKWQHTHPLVSDCQPGYLFAKRCLDIVGSVVAILLFSPIMFLAAVVIKLTDWGPVFYVHTRIGLGGKAFKCVKFRSMVVDADGLKLNLESCNSHDDSRTFKIPNDPRVTWVGRLMRRSSIDELPQLFNVLMGQMSLVGPRPPVPGEVAQYSRGDMRRLAVKPGLTCLWQVSGRSRLSFPEQLRLDIEYIEKRSLMFDLMLIVMTFPAVVKADGAY